MKKRKSPRKSKNPCKKNPAQRVYIFSEEIRHLNRMAGDARYLITYLISVVSSKRLRISQKDLLKYLEGAGSYIDDVQRRAGKILKES